MLFLHKLLPIFVQPLGFVFLILTLALWRKKRCPAFLAALVLYLSSIDIVAGNLIGWLESRYPAVFERRPEAGGQTPEAGDQRPACPT